MHKGCLRPRKPWGSARLAAQWRHKPRHIRTVKRSYAHTTGAQPIAWWLDGEGANFNDALDETIDGLAQEMSADFRFSAAKD